MKTECPIQVGAKVEIQDRTIQRHNGKIGVVTHIHDFFEKSPRKPSAWIIGVTFDGVEHGPYEPQDLIAR